MRATRMAYLVLAGNQGSCHCLKINNNFVFHNFIYDTCNLLSLSYKIKHGKWLFHYYRVTIGLWRRRAEKILRYPFITSK